MCAAQRREALQTVPAFHRHCDAVRRICPEQWQTRQGSSRARTGPGVPRGLCNGGTLRWQEEKSMPPSKQHMLVHTVQHSRDHTPPSRSPWPTVASSVSIKARSCVTWLCGSARASVLHSACISALPVALDGCPWLGSEEKVAVHHLGIQGIKAHLPQLALTRISPNLEKGICGGA